MPSVFLSIDSDPFVPDALSHQQLSAMLRAAMDPSAVPEGQLSDDELLRAALSAWLIKRRNCCVGLKGRVMQLAIQGRPSKSWRLGAFDPIW